MSDEEQFKIKACNRRTISNEAKEVTAKVNHKNGLPLKEEWFAQNKNVSMPLQVSIIIYV